MTISPLPSARYLRKVLFKSRRPFASPGLAVGLVAGLAAFGLGCATVPPTATPIESGDRPEATPEALAEPQLWRYALVIDASSSASTLKIFQWKPASGGGLPRVEFAPRGGAGSPPERWQKRVKPGLSSFKDRPNEAASSLVPLIEYALDKIGQSAEELARTQLFLRATAGVRILEPRDSDDILASVREYLETTPFGSTSARLITGAEEGAYGWFSVNYLLGHLEHGGPFPTVGALDLGGASTQITFQPLDTPKMNGQTITLGRNTYHLYTESYLGLGQDEARAAVASPACFLVDYPTRWGPGTGDLDACRTAIRQRLGEPCSETEKPCSLFGSYQPPLYGDFLAFSVYAYTAKFFGLDGRMRPSELEATGAAHCSQSWKQLIADDPSLADDPHYPNYCFAGAHIVTLLTDFGFPADTDRIKAPLRVQGASIDWTLGALIYELAGSPD